MRGGGGGGRGGGGGGFRGSFRGGARLHGRGWRPSLPAAYVIDPPWIVAIPDEDGAGAPFNYWLEGLDSDPFYAAFSGDEGHPMNAQIQQRVHIAGNIWVTISRDPSGVWCAESEIPTRYGGPIKLSARVDEQVIRGALERLTRTEIVQAVRRARRGLPAEIQHDEAAGGVFDDIGDFFTKTIPKAAKSVAKSKVFRQIAKGISDVAKNPIIRGAMSIIPGGGLLNEGMQQAGHAASLLAKAKSGDQLARAGLQTIANAAQSGNPKAKKSLDLLQAMNANPLSFMPGAESVAAGEEVIAIGAAVGVGPGRSQHAAALLARALRGDLAAQRSIQRIAVLADQGQPQARQIATALQGMAGAYSKAGVTASGGASWPQPGPVNDARYSAMVDAYHRADQVAAGGDTSLLDMLRGRRVRPRPKQAHPLRGHSITYGLPFRAR